MMLEQIEFLLRGTLVGLLLLLITLLVRQYRDSLAGRLGIAFAVSGLAYVLCPVVAIEWQAGWWGLPVYLLCAPIAVLFWLFSRAWFEDHFRLRWYHVGAVLLVCAMVVRQLLLPDLLLKLTGITPPPAFVEFREALPVLVSLGFILAALIQARFGKADDLVEDRRRFRDGFVIVLGGYMAIIAAVEVYHVGRPAQPLLTDIRLFVDVLVLLALLLPVMQLKAGVFRPSPARETAGAAPPAEPAETAETADPDRDIAAALDRFIREEQGHREPGLTIAALAGRLNVPEYRLRRVINGRLGHRNFSDFLNGHRIADACSRLADPDMVRVPVLTIALDVGFNSLGPFNRAFRETQGMTPVEYRRARLAEAGKTPAEDLPAG